jgi:hypothetical protein
LRACRSCALPQSASSPPLETHLVSCQDLKGGYNLLSRVCFCCLSSHEVDKGLEGHHSCCIGVHHGHDASKLHFSLQRWGPGTVNAKAKKGPYVPSWGLLSLGVHKTSDRVLPSSQDLSQWDSGKDQTRVLLDWLKPASCPGQRLPVAC